MPFALKPIAGNHVHTLARGQLTTLEDGAHTHLFIVGGELVETEMGGEHTHELEETTMDFTGPGSQPHTHLVFLPDGTQVETDAAGAHSHEAFIDTTGLDGSHNHTLPSGDISLTVEDYLKLVGPPRPERIIPTLAELLEMEMSSYETTVKSNHSAARSYISHDRPSFLASLRKAAREGNGLSVETAEEKIVVEETQGFIKNLAPTSSPDHPAVAFVGWMPSKQDTIRGEPFTGLCGATLKSQLLDPLGLERNQVALMNIVPEFSDEPDAEIWKGLFEQELADLKPRVIVALGKAAKDYLGDRADFKIVHPNALRGHDPKECAKKVRRLRKCLETQPMRISKQFSIVTKDEEKQVVTGIVLEPETFDGHDDIVSIDEIEQAAYNFLINSRVIGDSHSRVAPAELVESYLAPVDFELDGQEVKKGTWVVSVHIDDKSTWADVKSGHFNGLSIGGFAVKVPA